MGVSYRYPRPALTVDCVVFGIDDEDLKVLLIQRDIEPFEGHWALPGGFVQMDEGLPDAARRELKEETGLSRVFLEQLFTFGDVDRDPRGRVVSAVSAVTCRLSVISAPVTLCLVLMKVWCANSGDVCRPPDCCRPIDRLGSKKNPTGYPRLP